MELIKKFIKEDDGVTAIEYGLIAALIAVVIIVGVRTLGINLNTLFGGVASTVANPSATPAPAGP